jgi:hypothetical protein
MAGTRPDRPRAIERMRRWAVKAMVFVMGQPSRPAGSGA